MCSFAAVRRDGDSYAVDPIRCEGCKLCVVLCPEGAIDFPPRHCGTWSISKTRMGSLVHAQLFPGQENSGRLVALLRAKARELAGEQKKELIISDGPPGIGCPVISSLSGVSYAVAVTEPTPSGRHDLERVLKLCGHFKAPGGVIINKYDLNKQTSMEIETLAAGKGFDLLARLPFSRDFTKAMLEAKAISELGPSGISRRLELAWRRIIDRVRMLRAA